jgi:hypothetical protein
VSTRSQAALISSCTHLKLIMTPTTHRYDII